MELLEAILQYLTTVGLIQGPGIDGFKDFIPEEPAQLVSLIEYSGSAVLTYEEALHRSVQVNCRGASAEAAKSLVDAVFASLRPPTEDARIDFTTDRWGQVFLRQPPFLTKRDTHDRVTYTFNMGITTKQD